MNASSSDGKTRSTQNGPHVSPPVIGGERIINMDAALSRLGGDRELYEEMVTFFRDDSPSLLTDIEKGLDRKDGFAVAIAAHTLKNLAATCGGDQAARLAGRVETCGRNQDLSGAAESLVELADAVRTLDSALTDGACGDK